MNKGVAYLGDEQLAGCQLPLAGIHRDLPAGGQHPSGKAPWCESGWSLDLQAAAVAGTWSGGLDSGTESG